MKKIKLLSAIILCVIAIYSCSKDEETPAPAPVPTPTPVANVLCDGNGSNTFFPLALNNSWTYSYTIGNQSQNVHPNPTVTITTSHNSINYFKLEDQTHYLPAKELREDATSHNIYFYDSNTSSELLYVPMNPTLNQTWPITSGKTRQVTNLSASISTSNCSYSGLLEISEFDSNNALLAKEYFKKGVGRVQTKMTDTFFGGFDDYTLTSITLN